MIERWDRLLEDRITRRKGGENPMNTIVKFDYWDFRTRFDLAEYESE